MGRNTHSTKCMCYITVTVLTARVGECPILCISVVATLEWMPPPSHTLKPCLWAPSLLLTLVCRAPCEQYCTYAWRVQIQLVHYCTCTVCNSLMTTTTAMHLTFSVVMWPNTSMRLYYNCWASGSFFVCVCVCVWPVDINFVLFHGTYHRPIGNRILLSFPILFHYSNEKW